MGPPSTTRDLLPLLAEMNETEQSISLAAAAAAASLSPGHLQRIFSARLGESPFHYQQRLRLERGAVELRSSDARIIDIAIAVGFQSHESFTRAFTKRFGTTPSRYRTQSVPIDAADRCWPIETGPCLSLYRAPLECSRNQPNSQDKSKDHAMPSPDINLETVDETPTVASRRRVDREHIAQAIGECLPAAYAYAMEAGLTMAGPPFVRYVDESAAFVEIEAGVPLTEPAGAVDAPDLFAGTLPGGEAAVAVHVGSYDTLGETHIAIDRWMNDRDRTASGGPWEIYLTDPAEVPDPANWQTQIVWPLAS